MRNQWCWKTVPVFLILVCLSGCATRGDVTSIGSRLSEIELRDAEERRRREEIAKSREANEQALRQMSATLRAQIDELREEIRSLTGRTDEIEHSLRQKPAAAETGERPREDKLVRMEDISSQYDQRLARIEQHLNMRPVVVPPKPESKIKPETPAKMAASEEELYNQAKSALDQGQTTQARRGFEEMIQRYPNSANADNAQFWIGETFYREKSYEKAILEYQKVIEKYPKGNKLPAALLKQGYAFLALGDKVNSRLIFEELLRKYPQSAEAKAASDKLKEMR